MQFKLAEEVHALLSREHGVSATPQQVMMAARYICAEALTGAHSSIGEEVLAHDVFGIVTHMLGAAKS